jgi:hypothetical protein
MRSSVLPFLLSIAKSSFLKSSSLVSCRQMDKALIATDKALKEWERSKGNHERIRWTGPVENVFGHAGKEQIQLPSSESQITENMLELLRTVITQADSQKKSYLVPTPTVFFSEDDKSYRINCYLFRMQEET